MRKCARGRGVRAIRGVVFPEMVPLGTNVTLFSVDTHIIIEIKKKTINDIKKCNIGFSKVNMLHFFVEILI